jgi:chromosome segregation ATPase
MSRECDLLRSSLQHHERELSSTVRVLSALRQRCGVLEAINEQKQTTKDEDESVTLTDDADETEGHALDLTTATDDTAVSALLPSLSSSTAPLYVSRARLRALCLQFSIQRRRLTRVEGQLEDEQKTNARLLDDLRAQWEELRGLSSELERMHHEHAAADAERQRAAGDEEVAGAALPSSQSSSAFSSESSTSSLLLQLHHARTRAEQLALHNERFVRRFYSKLAAWCIVVVAACWVIAAL